MLQENVCACSWAVLAALSLLVNKIPPCVGHERFHVLAAGTVLWGIERLKLI